MILGDSIAVGVAQQRTECVAYAKSGINSYNWNNKYNDKDFVANTVIISLGSNDTDKIQSFNELLALRQSVKSDRVYWIVPAIKPHIKEYLEIIAKHFNDTLIKIPQVSKDGVHPTGQGYRELAERTKVK